MCLDIDDLIHGLRSNRDFEDVRVWYVPPVQQILISGTSGHIDESLLFTWVEENRIGKPFLSTNESGNDVITMTSEKGEEDISQFLSTILALRLTEHVQVLLTCNSVLNLFDENLIADDI